LDTIPRLRAIHVSVSVGPVRLLAEEVTRAAKNLAQARLEFDSAVIVAAWPSFALIGSYEMLMRQVRRSAAASGKK
jgi:hypothetical protein